MVFFLPETLQKSGPRRSANPIHALKLFLDPPLLVLVGTTIFALWACVQT
jgi:hypothetical protein